MPSLGTLTAYVPTPRDESGRLLTTTFQTLIDEAITAGVSAIGVLGSTGGFPYIPRSARGRVIRSAVEVTAGRVPVIAGIGAMTTAEVLANAAEAEGAGVDALLLPPVTYQPLLADEVFGLYEDVTSRTSTGVWVYNNPATTHYRFGITELGRLARMPGIQGFKDRAATASEARDRRGRVLSSLSPRAARRLEHGFSGDAIGAQILIDGASTWHSSVAGVAPHLPAAIAQAALHGQRATAKRLEKQLTSIALLSHQYGGIRVAHSLGMLLGHDMGQLPLPLLPLPVDAQALLRMAIESFDIPAELATAAARGGTPAHAGPAAENSAAESQLENSTEFAQNSAGTVADTAPTRRGRHRGGADATT